MSLLNNFNDILMSFIYYLFLSLWLERAENNVEKMNYFFLSTVHRDNSYTVFPFSSIKLTNW